MAAEVNGVAQSAVFIAPSKALDMIKQQIGLIVADRLT